MPISPQEASRRTACLAGTGSGDEATSAQEEQEVKQRLNDVKGEPQVVQVTSGGRLVAQNVGLVGHAVIVAERRKLRKATSFVVVAGK